MANKNMIQASDFITEANREIDNDILSQYIIEQLESQLENKLYNIKVSTCDRHQMAQNLKNGNYKNYSVAMVYAGNQYTLNKCKELFEPRGFIVELHPATGLTLRLP